LTAELFTDLSIDDYHARKDVLSKSMLADFMDCPARFKHVHIDGARKDDKDHLRLGNAVHTLALEPELFHERHYILPEGIRRDARTAAYKEHLEAAGTKTIIRAQDLVNVKGMADSLKANKKALALLQASGKIEASIFWTDQSTGLDLRCRPDFMRDDGLIVDLKTTNSACPDTFERNAFNLGYDVSVALTSEGYHALTGEMPADYVFLAVETEPPYLIEAYNTYTPFQDDVSLLLVGQKRLNKTLHHFAHCKKTNHWPGYSEGIVPLGVPGYQLKQLEAA